MPKIPRDIDGMVLVKRLARLGYRVVRQSGSHVRMTCVVDERQHHITIPTHLVLKIGTLNAILEDVSIFLRIEKETLIERLFR